jgi:pectinesterase
VEEQVIVAADGNGDYTRIQDAVDRVPSDNAEPVVIHIRNGIYNEKLHIEKPYITLIGEDPELTVIVYGDYARKTFPNGEPYHTFNSYSVLIGTHDFTAANLTFQNSAGPGSEVGQALAAYVDGDRLSFRNCRFLGHQDTIFTGPLPEQPKDRSTFGGPKDAAQRIYGRQYYEGCYIEGDVDFIFGSATAVFKDCVIFNKNRLSGEKAPEKLQEQGINGWITAASTPASIPYGYVFLGCMLTGDAPPDSVYLGRPWRNHAKTVFVDCWMGNQIRAEGWHNWNKPEAEETTFYGEYNSTGPGGRMDQRVKWAKILTAGEAAAYTAAGVLAGMDGWNPEREQIMT